MRHIHIMEADTVECPITVEELRGFLRTIPDVALVTVFGSAIHRVTYNSEDMAVELE